MAPQPMWTRPLFVKVAPRAARNRELEELKEEHVRKTKQKEKKALLQELKRGRMKNEEEGRHFAGTDGT